MHGLVDPLVKPNGGIATAAAIPGSRLVMYPDMGHDLPRPRWSEMIDEIRRTADRA
jgi:pimeloyl-ACP methyl ester carboxylesterase